MKSGFQLGIEAHKRCGLVLMDFRSGVTPFSQCVRRLMGIEESMYSEHPNAEPDGEITYAVATAHQTLLAESTRIEKGES